MLKKILLPLLLLAATLQLLPMESMAPEIDYAQLFLACEKSNFDLLRKIIENTPNININATDNEGNTLLLKFAQRGLFAIVPYLLQYGADKNIKNSDNHSLFSIVFYKNYYAFKNQLSFYTLDEITKECKTMPRKKWNHYNPLNSRITDVLNNTKNIHTKDREGCTALHAACILNEIPSIVELLKRGASLDTKDKQSMTPYQLLTKYEKHTPFVIREAFNNGPAKPAALLLHMFSDDQQAPLTKDLLPELTNHIKNVYINHCLVSDQERNAEKAIWEPVCVDACKLAGINETDESRCLTQLMLLSQRKKTEINLLLLKEDK